MIVKFAKSFDFAEDGINTIHFEAGQEYDVTQSCADSAAQLGLLDDGAEEKAAHRAPTRGRKKPPPVG